MTLVVGLQLFTILVSRGDVIVLGEAYAFGVVWSFVFKALAMLVLRFRKPEERAFKVPLNVRLGRYDVPIGISLIFLVLLAAAVTNVFTKPVSTISGGIFTATCFAVFLGSERHHRRRRGAEGVHEEHLEQFNEQMSEQVTPEGLALTKPHRKLVAIRSPHNLAMLKTCLDETDLETTEVVVLVADVVPLRTVAPTPGLSQADRELLTAVVSLGETEGKSVRPLIVQTNDPYATVARIARHDRRPGGVPGAVAPFPHRCRDRSSGPALDQKVERNARAAHDPRCGQEPRHASRHRWRQSYSPGR